MIREFISLSYYQLIISKPRLKYDKLTVYIKYNQEHESWLSYRLGIDTVQWAKCRRSLKLREFFFSNCCIISVYLSDSFVSISYVCFISVFHLKSFDQ